MYNKNPKICDRSTVLCMNEPVMLELGVARL